MVGGIIPVAVLYRSCTALRADARQGVIFAVIGVTGLIPLGVGDRIRQAGGSVNIVGGGFTSLIGDGSHIVSIRAIALCGLQVRVGGDGGVYRAGCADRSHFGVDNITLAIIGTSQFWFSPTEQISADES